MALNQRLYQRLAIVTVGVIFVAGSSATATNFSGADTAPITVPLLCPQASDS